MNPRKALLRALVTACGGAVVAAVASCGGGGGVTTDEQSYEVTQPIAALVVDARVADVRVDVTDEPVSVTEVHRFGDDRPATSHQVRGSTLHLVDTGCRNDEARCAVEFQVRLPAEADIRVTAQAGAVTMTGLGGRIDVHAEAGAFDGRALRSDSVKVTTESSAMALEFAEPPASVEATTEVGAIRVRVPSGAAYAVEADADLGASTISVQRDPASRHVIVAHSTAGAITVEEV
jgi:hypothetical protein